MSLSVGEKLSTYAALISKSELYHCSNYVCNQYRILRGQGYCFAMNILDKMYRSSFFIKSDLNTYIWLKVQTAYSRRRESSTRGLHVSFTYF